MEIVGILVFAAVSVTTLALGLALGFVTLSGVLALMQRSLAPVDPEDGASTGNVTPLKPRQVPAFEVGELLEAA
jgi:hypothetical protein